MVSRKSRIGLDLVLPQGACGRAPLASRSEQLETHAAGASRLSMGRKHLDPELRVPGEPLRGQEFQSQG